MIADFYPYPAMPLDDKALEDVVRRADILLRWKDERAKTDALFAQLGDDAQDMIAAAHALTAVQLGKLA
jgi:hypothetical protein